MLVLELNLSRAAVASSFEILCFVTSFSKSLSATINGLCLSNARLALRTCKLEAFVDGRLRGVDEFDGDLRFLRCYECDS